MPTPFSKAEEFNNTYNNRRLSLLIEKAKKSYDKYEIETIDYCKCIIEAICKEIYIIKEESSLPSSNFHTLVKDTVVILGMERGQFSGGISSIAQSLGELRNNHGLSGHGHSSVVSLPTKTQVDIVVSTFSSLVNIIISLLNNEDIDILKTTMEFSVLQDKLNLEYTNKYINKNLNIEYDKESGILFLEGKEVEPAKLLYMFDKINYNNKIKEFNDYLIDSIKPLIERILEEKFEELGCNLDYSKIEIKKLDKVFDYINITGIVEARNNLGDKIIDYMSNFSSKLNYEYDEDETNFIFSLDKVEFEKDITKTV